MMNTLEHFSAGHSPEILGDNPWRPSTTRTPSSPKQMAFEGLSEKLQNAFKGLKGHGVLTEADIDNAMRQVKLALLEALCSLDEANVVQWQPYDNKPYNGILKTLDYMEKVESEAFNLSEMAKMAGMSVSSYTQKFRALIGNSPGEYFMGIKLEKIRDELIFSELSITELADKYGFCDTSYMIKQFRKWHGISPAGYRNLAAMQIR